MLRTVAVRRADAAYSAAPFDPPRIWPELRRLGLTGTDPDNRVYGMVRRAFELMGLDASRAGGADWNPLGELVQPGERVVVKPNFVQHGDHAGEYFHLVTHPAVLRPVLDYLLLALGSLERVAVIDSPEISCDLERACVRLGWPALETFYEAHGATLRLVDIRTERADYRRGGAIVDRYDLPGDPHGFVAVDLGAASELAPIAGTGRFYGADYDRRWTNANHTREINRYVVSKSFLEADLVISVPKLKTHKKAGITCALKNLVGINGDKNLLPHYTVGDALVGGCEYSAAPRTAVQRLSRRMDRWYRDRLLARRWRLAGRVYNRLQPWRDRLAPLAEAEDRLKGDWWGNDVIWRTILDLNKILRYATAGGEIARRPVRRQLAVVDAVLAGEGDGPHLAGPRALGAVLAGVDEVAIDRLAARLIGFDPERIPQLAQAPRIGELPLGPRNGRPAILDDGDRTVELLDAALIGPPGRGVPPFDPPAGWADRLLAPPGARPVP